MTKNITSESFNQLLKAISSDKLEAGVAYTKLRDSLVRFFQLKGDFAPDEAADETLDRVAIKFSQNTEIDDLTKYSFGVARFIFLERLKLANKEKIAAEGFYKDKISLKTEEESDGFSPLRECFERLDNEEKNILQTYFADIPHSKLIEQREQFSVKNDISVNNLRLKIFRLRQRLENCVKAKWNK